ncbi:MAG: hypothetical protein NC433_08920 [Clostridiales bacterium]|nr:hypothetical protein [Clostridiales bacterium]
MEKEKKEEFTFDGIYVEVLNKTKNCNEVKSMREVAELIKSKKVDDLKELDVREKVLKIIYDNCDPESQFRKEYKKVDNILVKTAFGKKWASNYDYDDSLISSYIFCKTFKNRKWQIDSLGGYEYKICEYGICEDKRIYFRGDTMNSWSTTINEYMRLFGNAYIKDYSGRKIPKGYKSWESYLSERKNYKDVAIPEYINNFMKCLYTIGNFVLVPGAKGVKEQVNFNQRRNIKFRDYWDLTLLEIYNYYHESCDNNWICMLEEEDKLGKKEAIKNWLNKKEDCDTEGWNKFVEDNFMQPFLKKNSNGSYISNGSYNEPDELWAGHFEGKRMPDKEKQFEQFFVNSRIRILQRGELIAKALVDKKQK